MSLAAATATWIIIVTIVEIHRLIIDVCVFLKKKSLKSVSF